MIAEVHSSTERTMLQGSSARGKNDEKKGTTGEAGPAVPNRYMVLRMQRGLEGCIWDQVMIGQAEKRGLGRGRLGTFRTLVRVSAQRLTTKGLCLEKKNTVGSQARMVTSHFRMHKKMGIVHRIRFSMEKTTTLPSIS